jgi:hypothetical protein
MRTVLIGVAIFAVAVIADASQVTFVERPDYQSLADSPFDTAGVGSTFFVEDFEAGKWTMPGLAPKDAGPVFSPVVVGPAPLGTSIDVGGYSIQPIWEMKKHTLPIQYSSYLDLRFASEVDAEWRRNVGLAVTSLPAGATLAIELFGDSGESLGEYERVVDRLSHPLFIAASSQLPISFFEVKSSIVGFHSFFEVDHIQYGLQVPEPSTLVLLATGLACCAWRYVRR